MLLHWLNGNHEFTLYGREITSHAKLAARAWGYPASRCPTVQSMRRSAASLLADQDANLGHPNSTFAVFSEHHPR